jgi:hypothetical protein
MTLSYHQTLVHAGAAPGIAAATAGARTVFPQRISQRHTDRFAAAGAPAAERS